MARSSKNRRAMLGESLRRAAAEAAGILEGEQATPEQRSVYERAFFGESEEDGRTDPAGEVFGAGTGRGRRAIQADELDDLSWDPGRAYPQIQTRSTNPERPRTIAAGYDPKNAILRVTFRNGVTYEYLGPSPRQWSAFQRAPSPGQYINDVLEQYPYRPVEED